MDVFVYVYVLCVCVSLFLETVIVIIILISEKYSQIQELSRIQDSTQKCVCVCVCMCCILLKIKDSSFCELSWVRFQSYHGFFFKKVRFIKVKSFNICQTHEYSQKEIKYSINFLNKLHLCCRKLVCYKYKLMASLKIK